MLWWPSPTSSGWVGGRNKTVLSLFDDCDQTLIKGEVVNNDLTRFGPSWSLFWTYYILLLNLYLQLFTYSVSIFICMYELMRYYLSFPLMHFEFPVTLLTLFLPISWGSPLILKPYYWYHQTSRLSMVYKYVFVTVVNSDLFILSFTYNRVMVFTNRGTVTLHIP